jgi:hypothetical protein
MSIPLLHRHEDAFDERNEVLHAILGLAALSRRLDVLCAEAGSPAAEAKLGGDGAHQARQDVADALLGIWALKRRFDALVQAACAEALPARRPLQPRSSVLGPGLLR